MPYIKFVYKTCRPHAKIEKILSSDPAGVVTTIANSTDIETTTSGGASGRVLYDFSVMLTFRLIFRFYSIIKPPNV